MSKLVSRVLLFVAPFLALLAAELFVLPIDRFTFRVWEALYILQVRGLPPGRFYPSMTVAKVEQGDLAPYTPYAVSKSVVWHTDRFGFRKEDKPGATYPVVIVGDSGIVGTGLTQEDMLSEVLERRLGRGVYPYAPFDMNKFVCDRRFHASPPDTVVLAVMERAVPLLPLLEVPGPEAFTPVPRWKEMLKESEIFQRTLVLADRFDKQALLNYVRGRVKSRVLRWMGLTDLKYPRIGRMLFYEGETANSDVPEAVQDAAVSVLCRYREYLASRGIRFIFVAVPNKENLYCDLFPQKHKPVLLPSIAARLRAAGVETVDLQRPFEEAMARGETLYHSDDSHWNAAGVQIAAGEIAQVLARR